MDERPHRKTSWVRNPKVNMEDGTVTTTYEIGEIKKDEIEEILKIFSKEEYYQIRRFIDFISHILEHKPEVFLEVTKNWLYHRMEDGRSFHYPDICKSFPTEMYILKSKAIDGLIEDGRIKVSSNGWYRKVVVK